MRLCKKHHTAWLVMLQNFGCIKTEMGLTGACSKLPPATYSITSSRLSLDGSSMTYSTRPKSVCR